jgi:cyclic pyranopterin phosphate synthase
MGARMRRALPLIESRRARALEAPSRPPSVDPWTPLVDARGRAYVYARLSVTDRCDMACVYCMPEGGEGEHGDRTELTSIDESVRLASVLARIGVKRLRITGGEPLVRRGVVELVRRVREAGIEEVVLTTNASLLARHAAALAEAGLACVNVSIDSLDAGRFRAITRGGSLADVLAGIDASLSAGTKVKTNTVALGGVNDDELGAIVDWAWGRGITPRFIELMPIGEGARLPHERFFDAARIVARLGARVASGRGESARGAGPARYLVASDGSDRRVGLITAVSDDFCDDCNRLRITAHGEVRACLADRAAVSLRDAMRAGASDEDVAWLIHWALGAKAEGHRFTDAREHEHERVGMSLVGG